MIPVVKGRSIPDDNKLYNAQLDASRRLTVSQAPEWWLAPTGRILYQDTFEDAALKWSQNTGVVARDTTTAHYGGACLKLTTGAVAGNQAIARKIFQLPADQGSQQVLAIDARTARIITGCWFRQADLFLRTFTIRVVIDDTVRIREFWTQYHRRQVGVDNNGLEYLNSGGGTTNLTTYPIDDAVVVDVWNPLIMEVDYNDGVDPGGYGWYRSMRIGDFISKFSPGVTASLQSATGNTRRCFVDFIVTTDSANACSVFVDDFMLTDLSWALNQ